MKYYYCFFVLFQYHLVVRLCNTLPSRGQLFDFRSNSKNQSTMNQSFQSFITSTQSVLLQSRNPCQSIEKTNQIHKRNDRTRRDINGGTIDIKALPTTINDHRIMIENLLNNSINQISLTNALDNNDRIAPSISSWRDLVDLFFIGLFIITLIYVLIYRAGFAVCDKLFVFLFRRVLNRLQHQTQPQQQQQLPQHQTSTIPTAPSNTITEHIKSLSMIADGIQSTSNYLKK